MPRSDTYALRALRAVYRQFARDCVWTGRGGATATLTAIFEAAEDLQGVDGSALEIRQAGLSVRFIAADLAEAGVTIQSGDILTVTEPFYDKTQFHVDAPQMAFGRMATQRSFKISATTDATARDPLTPKPEQTPPAGYGFNPED